ncbi:thiol reductant ABC exporter subunit CydD [Arabiibacter massiliensis]|uniref:thiol reductant ABC exporter subunit CydD n=1 Tax=Arabiibacter massiliensis TaxID=1870985 RepID=UPI0009BA74E4|nr:thiol reductant ABC exporter subunit CydD [Arabiibacter massiliensis]
MIDRALFALEGIRGALAALLALATARAALVVAQAWALASAIVHLWEGAPLLDQAPLIALFLACFVGGQGVRYAQDSFLDRYAYARIDDLRGKLLRAVFTEGSRIVQAEGSGSVSALVLEGIDQVETYLRLILPKIVCVVVVPLVVLLCTFPVDWVSGLIMLVMYPVIVFYMGLIGATAKAAASRQHDEYRRLSNHFFDSMRGIDTLKLLGQGRRHGERIFEVSERFREATVKTLRLATLSGSVLDLISTLSLAAVAIMLGFRLVDGSIAFFPALFVLVLVPEYFKPIREFASDYHASLDGKNALASIQAIVASAPAGDASEGEDSGGAGIPAWDEESVLELADVGFSYPGREALSGVSFAARGFERIGVIGASGSGKSTLVNLLGGFSAPSAGGVRAAGREVADLRDPSWQRQVLYIPQDPYLFHATLRENIAFYRPGASEEDVERAVGVVGLDALVAELPDGLDTVVGEGARALSGGQAQRIALARALLDRSRRILLFDEPTAHLDIETELELKERMLPLMEGRLVFFATHRLHWVHDMDAVLVLEDGRVAWFGPPSELAARDGALARVAARLEGGLA